nr:MAG TPA: hypothetical protein [Caudoviricetes sp.]
MSKKAFQSPNLGLLPLFKLSSLIIAFHLISLF